MSAHGYISNRFYSPEEYFALAEKLGMKYEYLDGAEFVPVSDIFNHNEIISNVHQHLRNHLDSGVFRSFQEMVPVGKDEQHLLLPDVVVARLPDMSDNANFIDKPILIVEVLASNTSDTDWTIKWPAYMQFPSLQYELFVSQRKLFVQLYSRKASGGYQCEFFEMPGDSIHFPDLHFSMSIEAIYRNIVFPQINGEPMGIYADDE